MASELTTNFSVSYVNGSDSESVPSERVQLSVGGTPRHCANITVGTSEEAVALSDVATLGYAFIKNLDATNYVEFYRTTGDAAPTIKIPAGGWCFVPLGGSTLFAKANTASVLQ